MKITDLTDLISDQIVKTRYPWCKDERSITSAKKEVIGEILLKEYHILSTMYSERFRKVTDLDQQRAGVDFSSYSHKVDLKVSIGDYTDGICNECIPIELTQNGKTTFTKEKDTTDLLFCNVNLVTKKIYFVAIPYQVVLEIVDLNLNTDDSDIFSKLHPYYIYNKQTSYNGSAVFINMPLNTILNRVMVMEYPLNDDVLKVLKRK